MGLFQRHGRTFGVTATASGRLLLGRAAQDVQIACLRRLGADAPSEELLKEWGRATYLLTEQPGLAGEAEIAVPVVGLDGATAAALVATGAPPHLSREQLVEDVLPLLEHTAQLAGRMLANA